MSLEGGQEIPGQATWLAQQPISPLGNGILYCHCGVQGECAVHRAKLNGTPAGPRNLTLGNSVSLLGEGELSSGLP